MPTVFNGDFENGIRQSLYARATGADEKYRFPLSYELPGWSFHGGEGYRLDVGFTIPGTTITLPDFDFTGLFVFETDFKTVGLELVKKFFEWGAGKLLDIVGAHLKLKTFGIPKEPNTPFAPETSELGYKESVFDKHWSNNEDVKKTIDFAGKVFGLLGDLYDLLGGPTVGDVVPDSFEKWVEGFFQFDPAKKTAIPKSPDDFKKWLLEVADKRLQDLVKPSSDYALLMGGGDVLRDVLYVTVEALIGNVGKPMTDKLFNTLIEFDTITHNRCWCRWTSPTCPSRSWRPSCSPTPARSSSSSTVLRATRASTRCRSRCRSTAPASCRSTPTGWRCRRSGRA